MLRAGAERHQLHITGMEGAIVAEAVGMAEGAFPHIGDAFDVGVRVHRPDRTGSEAIVVEDAQRPDAHLSRIAITIEGEMPAGNKPAALFLVDLAVAADLQHRVRLEAYPVHLDQRLAGRRDTAS